MEEENLVFQQALEQEAEARIARMEEKTYAFPRRFSRLDWLLWGLVTAGSLVMLLLGIKL